MAKFYGKIGFALTVETAPGVWMDDIIERPYYGDMIQVNKKWEDANKVNDDLALNNRISIYSDHFASENCHAMKYVRFMGAKWKISNIEVNYPRLILSIGGLYNEQSC